MAIGISTQAGMFRGGGGYDADAQAWIDAVETADGEALEVGVTDAMNQMVLDYKAASLWTTIGTKVVLMGARTVAGAMIDIVTPASSWTNNNFVSGDYNRTTGLKGNGSTKYLDSNVAANTEAQNDVHLWADIHTLENGNVRFYCGSGISASGGAIYVRRSTSTKYSFICRGGSTELKPDGSATGLAGCTRSLSTEYDARANSTDYNTSNTSQTPYAETIMGFTSNNGGSPQGYNDGRIRAISFGAATTLSTCETIMDDFITAITALSL